MVLCCSSLLMMGYNGFGQNRIAAENYEFSFLKDSIKLNLGQFGFNSFTVYNPTTSKISLNLKMALPAGWGLVNTVSPQIELEAGQVMSIPVRLSPSANSVGNITYPISVLLKNNISQNEENYTFFVKISQVFKWNASLLSHVLNITPSDTLPKFSVKISNKGNRKELFLVDFKSDLRLSHASSGLQLLLAPNQDTTINVFVRSKYNVSSVSAVEVLVTTRDGVKQLNQQIYFISDTYQVHKSKYASMTLDASYTGFNGFNTTQISNNVFVNGRFELKKARSINFFLRSGTDFFGISSANNFKQLNYTGSKFSLSVGSQTDFLNYQINGNGVNMQFISPEKQVTEVFGVRNLGGTADIIGFRQEIKMGETKELKSYGLYVDDKILSTSNYFSVHSLSFKIGTKQTLSITGGVSGEKKINLGEMLAAGTYGYRYQMQVKRLSIRSYYNYFSPNFPGFTRGLKSSEHEGRIYFGDTFFGLFSSSNNKEAGIAPDELTNSKQFTEIVNTNYGFRLGFPIRRASVVLYSSQVIQKQGDQMIEPMLGIRSGLSFTYRKGHLSQTFTAAHTRSSVENIMLGKVNNSLVTFLQLKYKELGVMANYDSGPNFYFDYVNLESNGIRPFRQNVSVFFDLKSKNKNIIDRASLGYLNSSYNNFPSLLMRHDVTFNLPKYHSSLSVTAGVDFFNINNIPSISFTYKKMFNIPMAIKPKYHDLKLFMFKDGNNNGIFDRGESTIENGHLVVNGNHLITNKNGQATLKNADKGDYLVDFKNIKNVKGWVVTESAKDTIVLKNNMSVGIPFKESKIISGKLVYQNLYAVDVVPPTLGGVLVVAVNRQGDIFKAITNTEGEFFFNLNADIYNVQIPNNMFEGNLFIEKSVKSVDLRNYNSSNLEFKILQKKRQINIKKAN